MGKVPNSQEYAQKCICGDCPSKPDDGAGFYCATGESPESVNQRGCICGDCENHRTFDLQGGYYCVEGAA